MKKLASLLMAILMCITCAPYAPAFESFTDPYNGGLVIRDGSVIYYLAELIAFDFYPVQFLPPSV